MTPASQKYSDYLTISNKAEQQDKNAMAPETVVESCSSPFPHFQQALAVLFVSAFMFMGVSIQHLCSQQAVNREKLVALEGRLNAALATMERDTGSFRDAYKDLGPPPATKHESEVCDASYECFSGVCEPIKECKGGR